MLEQGPMERQILEDCHRHHMPIPQKIQSAPTLRLGLDLFLMGFMDLSSCRPAGFGVSPIPWTAIHEYCERIGVEDDQRDDMLYHVQIMDQAFLGHHSKKGK